MAYHPQANGLVERRNEELLNHLRSLVYEKRIRDLWCSKFLTTLSIHWDATDKGYLRLSHNIGLAMDISQLTGQVEMSKTIWSSSEKVKQR